MVDLPYVHFLCPLKQSSCWRDFLGVVPRWTLQFRCPVINLGVFTLSSKNEVSL